MSDRGAKSKPNKGFSVINLRINNLKIKGGDGMIEEVKSIVREYSDDAIINNPAIPNDKNEKAIETTANSLIEHIKDEARTGNTHALLDILKKNDDPALNPSVNRVSTGVAGDLVKKLGVDNSTAMGVVNKIIPPIIDKIRTKANDPGEKEINLNNFLGSFNRGGNLMDSVKNIFGRK
ncbi:MAG TPA: hypothetical protein VK212_00605 [Lentimicrobium sp.]|nr:hypothetical protein [Lentimicrobium sp.]